MMDPLEEIYRRPEQRIPVKRPSKLRRVGLWLRLRLSLSRSLRYKLIVLGGLSLLAAGLVYGFETLEKMYSEYVALEKRKEVERTERARLEAEALKKQPPKVVYKEPRALLPGMSFTYKNIPNTEVIKTAVYVHRIEQYPYRLDILKDGVKLFLRLHRKSKSDWTHWEPYTRLSEGAPDKQPRLFDEFGNSFVVSKYETNGEVVKWYPKGWASVRHPVGVMVPEFHEVRTPRLTLHGNETVDFNVTYSGKVYPYARKFSLGYPGSPQRGQSFVVDPGYIEQ